MLLQGHWYIAAPAGCEGTRDVCIGALRFTLRRDSDGAWLAEGEAPPLREADGYVWAYVGEGEPAGPPPAIPAMRRRGYAFEQRTFRFAANQRLVLENALDFAHSAFAHPFVQPSWFLHRLGPLPPMKATYRPTADGLSVDATLGPMRMFEHEFALPDRLRLVMLPGWPWPVEVTTFQVPEGPDACRMEVLLARPAWPWEPKRPRVVDDVLKVLEQDRELVEAQQRLLADDPAPREEHCAADGYTLLLRRVLAAAARGEWPGAAAEPARTVAIRI